jgi:hypothetical protein
MIIMARVRIATLGLTVLLASMMGSLAFAAAASTEKAVEGLSSNKNRGSVSIYAEPALDKGRLVFRVTGINRTDQPVSLTDGDVKVFTAAGRQVGLIKLDQLIAEARGATSRRPFDHDDDDGRLEDRMGTRDRDQRDPLDRAPTDSSTRGVTTDQWPNGSSVSVHAESPGYQAKADALKEVILQAKIVQPSKADGGKLVTEKLRFGRKDEHALRVQVNFAGEQHEFNFIPPES